MLRKNVSVDRVLKVLNRAVEADPEAMHNLIEQRVPCNANLASDPDIQVGTYHFDPPQFSIGFLGILNGIFGNQEGWGAISAIFDLECSQDPRHVLDENQQLVDDCPKCGSKIIIGNLREFVKSPAIN